MSEAAEEQAAVSPQEGLEIPEGGGAAVGVLEPAPALAVSPVSEEPAGDTKKKSKASMGAEGAALGAAGCGRLKLAALEEEPEAQWDALPSKGAWRGKS